MSKHNGNIEVYGTVTIGVSNGEDSYKLPEQRGTDGESIVMVNGEAVFTDVAQYINLSDISGGLEIVEKVNDLSDAVANSGNITNYVFDVNNVSGGISILPGSGIEVATDPNGQITISLYQAITISSFTGGSSNEIGSTVNSVSLNWTLSKTETSQSLNQGIGSVTNGVRTYAYTDPITTNTTFTLSVTDGTSSPTANTTVSFLPRVWWGTDANTSLASADILTLDNNALSSTKTRSFTIDGNGEYLYYAYPSSYGAATFTVNGLLNTAWTLSVVSHTNASGHTQNYNVYRSNTIQNGSGISIAVS